ncbi:MAG TPA: histidine phosphatase family protein [Acidimicrobiales bacterium]|nr:histidine phosphatase family protein [Acidimicrobiales bacterium]
MVTTTFLLVRHGETTWNAERRIQGHSDDAGLTERGIEQVRAAAEQLAERGARRIVSSDLTRARETATIIAERLGLSISLDADLRERSYGELEGRSLDELSPDAAGFSHGVIVDVDAAAPGGESIAMVKERVTRTLEHLAREHAGETLIVVTHGGVIRTLRAAQEPAMVGSKWNRVDNAEVWALSMTTH